MEFKVEITKEDIEEMIKDGIENNISELVIDSIKGTDLIWVAVEKCIHPYIIDVLKNDKGKIEEIIIENIKEYIDNGDWLNDDKVTDAMSKKIVKTLKLGK